MILEKFSWAQNIATITEAEAALESEGTENDYGENWSRYLRFKSMGRGEAVLSFLKSGGLCPLFLKSGGTMAPPAPPVSLPLHYNVSDSEIW